MNERAKKNRNVLNSQTYVRAYNTRSSCKRDNAIKKLLTQACKRKPRCSSNKNVLREVQLNHIERSCINLPSNSISTEMYEKNIDKSYDCQIQYLNRVLQNPLSHIPLTQEELNKLFTKYKMDGHYRTNTDLPAFSTFANNTDDATDTDSHYSDNTEWQNYMNYCETSYQNNNNMSENLYYNNAQQNPENGVEQNTSIHKDCQYLQYESQVLSNNNHEPYMAQNRLYNSEQNTVKEYNSCMFSDIQNSDHLEHMFLTNNPANIEKQENFEYPFHYSNITDLTSRDTFETKQFNNGNMIPLNPELNNSNSFYDAEVNNEASFMNLNTPENVTVESWNNIQPSDTKDWQSCMNNNYTNTNVNIAPHFMDTSYSNNYYEESSFNAHDNMNTYQYAVNNSNTIQHNYSDSYSVMQGSFNSNSYENMYGSTISTA